jgi:hypothetical protein
MIDHRNLDGCHGQVCSGIFQTTLLWAIQALSLRSFMQTIADIRTTCLPLVPPPALSLSEQLARQRTYNVSSVLEGQHAPSHCVNFGQELLIWVEWLERAEHLGHGWHGWHGHFAGVDGHFPAARLSYEFVWRSEFLDHPESSICALLSQC